MKTAEQDFSLDAVPESIRQIMDRFHQNGFDVWVVGGALRDFFFGLTPKDWDLATSASPQQVTALFRRVIPVGLRYGTVQINIEEGGVEITSCPSAGLKGILADLQRRDFTVNALAFSYPEGKLSDPFGGLEDIFRRTLRSVGDASSRFGEDPLRTLRAGRFLSVYGFDIDPQTFLALQDAAPGLRGVSHERVREEFFKMLLGKYFSAAFGEMMRGGVIQEFLPELTSEPLDHCVHAVHYSPFRLRVRLAALFHHLPQVGPRESDNEPLQPEGQFREAALAAAAIMRRFRTSRRLEREVAFLVEHQVPEDIGAWTDAEMRFFLAKVGEDLLQDVLDLAAADRTAREDRPGSLRALQELQLRISRELKRKPPLRIEDLAVDGRDIMSTLQLDPGPAVGEVLRDLHRQVLRNPALNQAKNLIDFLRKEYHIKSRFEK